MADNDTTDPLAQMKAAHEFLTEKHIAEAITAIKQQFPGTWEHLIYVYESPFPDGSRPDVGSRAEMAFRNIWTTFDKLQFLQEIEGDDFRSSVTFALFESVLIRVQAEAGYAPAIEELIRSGRRPA